MGMELLLRCCYAISSRLLETEPPFCEDASRRYAQTEQHTSPADHTWADKETQHRCHTGSLVPSDIWILPVCPNTCSSQEMLSRVD